MSVAVSPKATSFGYGAAYQREQVEKHRRRRDNHWRARIELAHRLIDTYVLPRIGAPRNEDVSVLDVGCSIGTMSIEMAARGFTSYGVDFDAAALNIARGLASEDGVSVEFFNGDVAAWTPSLGRTLDIALCFDIFEHLHDDELGGLLQTIRRHLSPNGSLVFHTFPLQFDYVFYSRDVISWPLIPFAWLSADRFSRFVRAYASLLDAGLVLATGQTYRERIKKISHCNPTTLSRLTDILERSGYSIGHIESGQLYTFKPHILRWFGQQPVAHRNVYGVAYPSRL